MGQDNSNSIGYLVSYFASRGPDSEPVLMAVEGERDIPFEIKRVFWVYVGNDKHGFHAHRKCRQVVFCVRGAVKFQLSKIDPDFSILKSMEFILRQGEAGILIEPYTYLVYEGVKHADEYGDSAIIVVMASEPYEFSDVITSSNSKKGGNASS